MRRLMLALVFVITGALTPCFAAEEPAEGSVVEAIAVEAVTDAPVVDATEAVAPWWLEHAASSMQSVVALIIGVVFVYLGKKLRGDKAREDALAALEAGVQNTWVKFGKTLKQTATDGKLSDTEKDNLRAVARECAIELAKGAGKDMLIAWAKPYVDSLISRIVERRKAGS